MCVDGYIGMSGVSLMHGRPDGALGCSDIKVSGSGGDVASNNGAVTHA